MTLTLLPGLMCDAAIFRPQLIRFRDAAAVDGFGKRRSIREMAAYVLDNGPATMSLAGHSMGARVALEVYRAAPHRIRRLALISTGVHPVAVGEAEKRYALRNLGIDQGTEALVNQWLPPMVAASRSDDAHLMAPLREMACRQGVEVYAAQIEALLSRPEVESILPTIRCPTLVAVGSEDVWSPPEQHERIASAIPGATLRVIKGAGHMLPWEKPKALNQVLEEWLQLPLRH